MKKYDFNRALIALNRCGELKREEKEIERMSGTDDEKFEECWEILFFIFTDEILFHILATFYAHHTTTPVYCIIL